MHPSVREAWHRYSEPFEGRVLSMYLDMHEPDRLVTCGVGNLIDPVSEALKVPWYRDSDNERASEAEVRAAWAALKSRPDLARRHVRHARALTGLHLLDADVDALVARRLAENEAYIAGLYPEFPSIPADAQLGILSMAWAAGAGFFAKFPNFTRAVRAHDWLGAQVECTLRESNNPGVVPRNKANRVCFGNAALVDQYGLDVSVLHWPKQLTTGEAERLALPPTNPTNPGITASDRALADARLVEHGRDLADSNFRDHDDGESEPPPPGSV